MSTTIWTKSRLIESKNDWDQFIEITKINFPEDINKVEEEGLEYHQQKGCYLFGYYVKKKILGSIGIKIIKPFNLGIIGYLQVNKTYRMQGIAKKLFNKALEIAKKQSCYFLYLAVNAKNKQTTSIYRHWGFKQVPMIYNINNLEMKGNAIENIETKTKKRLIKSEKELEKVITKMYLEYHQLNKVYHYFELMYELYSKKFLHYRKKHNEIHLVVISEKANNKANISIFLLKDRKKDLDTIKEEIKIINTIDRSIKKKIVFYGKLEQEEIKELENIGIQFESAIEYNGFLLELNLNK